MENKLGKLTAIKKQILYFIDLAKFCDKEGLQFPPTLAKESVVTFIKGSSKPYIEYIFSIINQLVYFESIPEIKNKLQKGMSPNVVDFIDFIFKDFDDEHSLIQNANSKHINEQPITNEQDNKLDTEDNNEPEDIEITIS